MSALLPVALAAGILFGAAAGVLPLAIVTGQLSWLPRSLGNAEIACGLSIPIYALFTWLFLEIIRMAGPAFFAQFNYLAIVAGLGWSWVVFRERYLVVALLWAVLILVLGNLVTAFYTALALYLADGDWVEFWLGARRANRAFLAVAN